MPYSASALDLGLRLRSQRVRTGRSRGAARGMVIALVAVVVLGALSTSSLRAAGLTWTTVGVHLPTGPRLEVRVPTVGKPSADEQRYLDAMLPIHVQIEQSVVRMGLGAAVYKSRDIDRSELKTRVDQGLASYRDAEAKMQALRPPPTLRGPHEGYLAAVRL